MTQVFARRAGWQAAPGLAAEPALQGVEHRPVAFAEVLPGSRHGVAEERQIFGAAPASMQVSAVHRIMLDQRLQRPANRA
ncbi:hypothetical protein D3C79_944210 [compost metagenome]